MRRLLLALLAVAALAGCGLGGTSASLPPLSGHVVISRDNNLWVMRPDGKDERQITSTKGGSLARDPAFSPDGSKVAYSFYPMDPAKNTWSGPELWVVDSGGGGARQLVGGGEQGERFEMPAWASNNVIYYSHDRVLTKNNQYVGDDFSVDQVDVATGKRQTVVKNATSPTLSADGKLLAYLRLENFQISLLVQPANGEGTTRKLLGPDDFLSIYAPRLSPDGSTIVFAGNGRTNSRVGQRSGGQSPAAWLQPLWPERASAHGLPFDLWTINVDGTNLRRIAALNSDEFETTWSPDGKQIATIGFDGLWVMNADGSARTQFLKQGEPAGVDWAAK